MCKFCENWHDENTICGADIKIYKCANETNLTERQHQHTVQIVKRYGKKTDILLTQVMIRQTIRLQKWIESKIMLQTYENFILWT